MLKIKKTSIVFFLAFLVIVAMLAAATIVSEFHVKTTGNSVSLEWKTQQETNLKEFKIKRSTDQVNYSIIGTVPAKKDGLTNHSYSYTDSRLFKGQTGNLYYKLVLINLQGQSTDHDAIASTAGISGIRHTWGSLKAIFR